MKVNKTLKGMADRISCLDTLKKLKDIFVDSFGDISEHSTGYNVVIYNELCHFRDTNIKYLDKRIKKIEKDLEKLIKEDEND